MSRVLVTGAAGFIGFHLSRHYLLRGSQVIATDNPAYLTEDESGIGLLRQSILKQQGVIWEDADLSAADSALRILRRYKPTLVFHLAAHTSIRSMQPERYQIDNIDSSWRVLRAAESAPPAHLLFASSSSVYGEHSPRPFSENSWPLFPANPYGRSKLICEKLAGRGWSFPITGIRLFNVYGPWGRTNMAPFRFTERLCQNQTVEVFSGDAQRSWLYIDDAIKACTKLALTPPDHLEAVRAVNVAGPHLVKTWDLLYAIAALLDKHPQVVIRAPKEPEITSNPACLKRLERLTGYVPTTELDAGLARFVDWYQRQYSKRPAVIRQSPPTEPAAPPPPLFA